MPSKKKKYNARFPAGRIKKIMQTDEEVGKVAQAVPVIISRTLELFVESLLTKSLEVTQQRNAKTLSPSHLKQCILAENRFDFLRDLVKNIPDTSQSEERESCQTWHADSLPNVCRNSDVSSLASTSALRGPRQLTKKGNGQSSDSGSDCDPGTKKQMRTSCGNGKSLQRQSAIRDDVPRVVPIKVARIDAQNIPVTTFGNASESTTVIGSLSSNIARDSSSKRLPNFYTETLKDEDESNKEVKNVLPYSSVIQPNPEYSQPSSAGAQKGKSFTYFKHPKSEGNVGFMRSVSLNDALLKSNEKKSFSESGVHNVPKLHLDLSKGFLQQNSSTAAAALKVSAENNLRNDLPLTTIIRQPQSTTFQDRNYFPSIVQRLEGTRSHLSTKKDVPPLQTLQRSTSELTKSAPKIHIDLLNIPTTPGQTPKFHLDFSKYNFEKSHLQSPTVSNPKKKKTFMSNEPPPLLPIAPTQKSHTITSVNCIQATPSTELQIDEDYDT